MCKKGTSPPSLLRDLSRDVCPYGVDFPSPGKAHRIFGSFLKSLVLTTYSLEKIFQTGDLWAKFRYLCTLVLFVYLILMSCWHFNWKIFERNPDLWFLLKNGRVWRHEAAARQRHPVRQLPPHGILLLRPGPTAVKVTFAARVTWPRPASAAQRLLVLFPLNG